MCFWGSIRFFSKENRKVIIFFSQDSHSFFQLFVYLFIYLEHEKYVCKVKPKVGGISKRRGLG